MPLYSFYRLADQLGDIKQRLIFIDFVPRSGSTLVGQIFEETGVCVNYSEPHFLMNNLAKNRGCKECKILKAAITFYCKPRQEHTEAFVFKSPPFGKSYVPLLHELFPKAKFLHLTRNVTKNALSILKVTQVIAVHRIMDAILFTRFLEFLAMKHGFNEIDMPLDEVTAPIMQKSAHRRAFNAFYVPVCTHGLYLKKLRHGPFEMPAIKYKDILSNPDENIRIIFEFCGLDPQLVTKASRALHKDSQAGSPLSQQNLQNHADDLKAKLTEASVIRDAKTLAGHWGLSDIMGDLRLPGTITKPPPL
jgi:hypothetical protein